jgi:hypothetical protein
MHGVFANPVRVPAGVYSRPAARNPVCTPRLGLSQLAIGAASTRTNPMVAHASATGDLGIESVGASRPEVEAAIQAALGACLTETDLDIGKKYRVRMTLDIDGHFCNLLVIKRERRERQVCRPPPPGALPSSSLCLISIFTSIHSSYSPLSN